MQAIILAAGMGKRLGEYTKNYIMNLYRKKSLRCKGCKYNDECE
jgi:choline kinase